ncbi:MAG: hypothetical protein J0H62_09270, partial [Rhizobiales bacterium]|nr:hypothetical protein [Hyphomicrobiales bacterium]
MVPIQMPFRIAALLVTLSLPACAAPAAGPSGITIAGGGMNYHVAGPAPGGCAAAIAEFESLIDSDERTG